MECYSVSRGGITHLKNRGGFTPPSFFENSLHFREQPLEKGTIKMYLSNLEGQKHTSPIIWS